MGYAGDEESPSKVLNFNILPQCFLRNSVAEDVQIVPRVEEQDWRLGAVADDSELLHTGHEVDDVAFAHVGGEAYQQVGAVLVDEVEVDFRAASGDDAWRER